MLEIQTLIHRFNPNKSESITTEKVIKEEKIYSFWSITVSDHSPRVYSVLHKSMVHRFAHHLYFFQRFVVPLKTHICALNGHHWSSDKASQMGLFHRGRLLSGK